MRLSSPIPHKRARIEIIPLIDIMFFLLASFMMVSLSQTHMKGIKVNLPSQTLPPPSPKKEFVSIRAAAGQVYYFDGQYVQEDEVMPRLFALHQANPDIKVSISAEPMAMHGDVIGLLDKVRQAKIEKVGYQIRTTGAGGAPPPAGPQTAPPAQAPPPPH
jgi:biopolymer transport protein ExbD